MAQFDIGINASIMGAAQLARFRQQVQALGLAVNDLGDELHTVNGQQVREFRVSVNATTAAAKANVRALVAAIDANSRFGATSQDAGNAAQQAARHYRQQQQAIVAATRAANNHTAALARLQQRQALVTQAQQIRINQTNASRVVNRQDDADEFDRRRNTRLQDEQDRANRQMLAAQQRHTMAMQRISAYGSGAGPGAGIMANLSGHAIGKVLAYDALRRTLTNIYQMMGRIGDQVADWVVESIKFNDEMKRAEIVFTGLGLLGLKNQDGSSMTIAEAEKSKDPKVASALSQSKLFGEDMINKALKVAVMTGQDTNEMVAAARQLSTDLMNKKSNVLGKGKNAVLDNPAELAKVTEEMLMIGAALKMADPGGRKLGFHMVAVQELFSGTNGGKKDTGLANVRSMMMREGIKIREADALPIAQAVNKGELNQAAELIKVVMEKAGMSGTSSKNLLEGTLMPNVDGVKTMAMQLTGKFTQGLTDGLIKNFYQWRMTLARVLDNKQILAVLKSSGENFSKAFDYVLNSISDGIDNIINNPKRLAVALDAISKSLSDTIQMGFDFSVGVGKFVAGFMGLADGKTLNLSSIKTFTTQFSAMGTEAGIRTKSIFQSILNITAPIVENLVPSMIVFLETIEKIVLTLEQLDSILGIMSKLLSLIAIVGIAFADLGISVRRIIGGLLSIVKADVGIFSKGQIDEDHKGVTEYAKKTIGEDALNVLRFGSIDSIADVLNRPSEQKKVDPNKPRIPEAAVMKPGSTGTLSPAHISSWSKTWNAPGYGESVQKIPLSASATTKVAHSPSTLPYQKMTMTDMYSKSVEGAVKQAGPVIAKSIETGITKKPIIIQPTSMTTMQNIYFGDLNISDLQTLMEIMKGLGKGNPTKGGHPTKGYPTPGAADFKAKR